MYKKVETKPDFIKMEKEILNFWERNQIFGKLIEKNKGNDRYSFFDGPITANNPMGVHHAWGRTYKDVYQRYKAMKGYQQRYQNGFDCQGLWVEVEVEKDIGLNSKREIENYGIDNFSRKCRERVEKYSNIIAQQSIRLGQWMDWENSYYTMSDTNIEYIWYFLKKCYENGWLYLGKRLMPWCVRCGTSLSQHELIDSYKEMIHTSVFLKLPIVGRGNDYIMVWTTTPWTLSSNTALAVHPDLEYKKVKQNNEYYYLSGGTLSSLIGDYEIVDSVKGKNLAGLKYVGPVDDFDVQKRIEHKVILWDEVGEQEGTGVVHIAPGCGEEDFELSKIHNLDVLVPFDDNGIFKQGYGFLSRKIVTEVAELMFEHLKNKGFLYKLEDYAHRYPVCWRCGEELVFTLVTEWFISSSEIKERMIRCNREVTWHPQYGQKRMEDWLLNMGDWCISRKRYWGLPLPFYVCDCGEINIIGTRKELEERAVEGLEQLQELHKPWIDRVKIKCNKCGNTVERIKEVGDCWLDAGIIPFSTLHYFDDKEYWQKWFPANFVTEMREQIRLWFYSLLFMSVTLEDKAPYKEVLIYEKAYDERGVPMHKSLGNAIWFSDAVERMGADVMRWIYVSQNIMTNLRFGYGVADEVRRKLLTLWNTYSFFVMYAEIDKFNPTNVKIKNKQLAPIDIWILAKLNRLVQTANKELDNYNVSDFAKAVEDFLDDLSNWYIRRSRRRFWKSENDEDKLSAYYTLYNCLVTSIKIIAPILPFMSEEIYQNLVASINPDEPESVHLCKYPEPDPDFLKDGLTEEIEFVKKIVEMGRSIRNKVQIKVRQPLAEIFIKTKTEKEKSIIKSLKSLILDELNVKKLNLISDSSQLVSHSVKLKYNIVGPKYGKKVKEIEQYINNLPIKEIEQKIRSGSGIEIQGVKDNEEKIVLLSNEFFIVSNALDNIAVLEEDDYIVALNTNLTKSLILEGITREFVRHIQDIRKETQLNVMDRIIVHCNVPDEVKEAIQKHIDYIKRETLAEELIFDGLKNSDNKRKIGDYETWVNIKSV
jgi:isoleucyl-tRNA synthetase